MSTPNHIVMDELSRYPLCFGWLKQSLRFWNKNIRRNSEDLVSIAMSESARLNIGWVNELQCALKNLGCDAIIQEHHPINVAEAINQAKARWKYVYGDESNSVREIPDIRRTGFKSMKYQKWFSPILDSPRSPFFYTLHRQDQIKIIAQFRMCSSHWLDCEKLRKVGRADIPRSLRHCRLCKYNRCEDEMHLFECPFYNEIRSQFQHLFSRACRFTSPDPDITIWNVDLSDSDMRNFMNGDGSNAFWSDLADYLLLCKKKRQDYLDLTCDRVSST